MPNMQIVPYPFNINGNSHTLQAEYYTAREMPPPDSTRGAYTLAEVERTIERLKYYWNLFMTLEFKSFGVLIDGSITYRISFDRSKDGDGRANDAVMTLDTKRLNDGDLHLFNHLLIHEMFHACQFASIAGMPFGHEFNEGTANVAAFLVDPGVRTNLGISSYKGYLDNPGATMWDRPTPGKLNDNQSIPTLWWLYFCDQLGRTTDNIGGKMDALERLLAREWPQSNAWGDVQSIFASANFLGNEDDQILFVNSDSGDLGLVSVNKSYGGDGATHTIIPVNERWGVMPNTGRGGWKSKITDRVYGQGDLLGNGRTQLILKSRGPVYIGILGFKDSDCSPRRPVQPETYCVRLNGNAWSSGGWEFESDDIVESVGNFVFLEKEHFIIKRNNPIRMGILGLTSTGEAETIAQVAEGSTFGSGGWTLLPGDEIVGKGDFLGNGRDQFIIRSSSPTAIGVVGFSPTGNLETYAVVKSSERGRFGNGWRVRDRDRIVATGRIVSSNRCHMVIQAVNPAYLGVVGFTDSGETESVLAIPEGQALGNDWIWSSTDRFLGVGDFVGEGKQQLAVLSWERVNIRYAPLRLALINFESDGSINSHDYADKDRGNVFSENSFFEYLGIGDFAGLGRDQLLTTHKNGASYLRNISLETLDAEDIGHWRHQFTIGTEASFFSSHLHLNEFIISETSGRRNFETFWRDFTITNLTREMSRAPEQLKYSFTLDSHLVNIDSALRVGDRISDKKVKRWSAVYFQLQPPTVPSVIKLQAGQHEIDRMLYWTVVVSDQANNFKEIFHYNNAEIFHLSNLNAGDQVTLVVTGTYSSSNIWLEYSN